MIAEFKNLLVQKGLEYFGRYYSIYRGTVASNEDPQQLGRLRLAVPQLYAQATDYWAWPRGVPAGAGWGLFAIPSKGDMVWVTFENGDVRFPVWEFGWWRPNDIPEAAKRASPTNFVFQTPKGNRLELDDEKNLIRFTNQAGVVLEINEKGIHQGQQTQAEYKQVLGEKLTELLSNFLSEVTALTVLTAMGESSIPVNIAKFEEIKSKLNALLSTKNTLN